MYHDDCLEVSVVPCVFLKYPYLNEDHPVLHLNGHGRFQSTIHVILSCHEDGFVDPHRRCVDAADEEHFVHSLL